MKRIVTSFTREIIPHERVSQLASCVLSVVLNSAKQPQDMKLVPYEEILKCNNLDGLRIKKKNGRFIAVNRCGKGDKVYHSTEVAARIAHWAGKMEKATKQPSRNVRHNNKNTHQPQQVTLA